MGRQYTDRLLPRVVLVNTATRWSVEASQPSLDGKNHLWLTLSGDARRSRATLAGRVATIRPLGANPITVTVEIATDGPPLSPLNRTQIFSDQFRRFTDSAKSPRVEREIRGFELLSSKQKLMAGLPTYATYLGRDMLMTALLVAVVIEEQGLGGIAGVLESVLLGTVGEGVVSVVDVEDVAAVHREIAGSATPARSVMSSNW